MTDVLGCRTTVRTTPGGRATTNSNVAWSLRTPSQTTSKRTCGRQDAV